MESQEGELSEILSDLFYKTGLDFQGYRQATLHRRVARRLSVTQCPTYGAYRDYLSNHPGEYENLLKDLTIHVTEAFRDPESWDIVRKTVIPALLEKARTNTPTRVWSAGCATGEETYSLAILFKEANFSSLSLLGTDLDEASLSKAHAGVYSLENLKAMPTPLREKYFQRLAQEYRVVPEIREGVEFQRSPLTAEGPDQSFDLIGCRNVLIYFSWELQEKVLTTFYHALNPDGFLWLGQSESLWGRSRDFFKCVNKEAKIFKKARVRS